MLLHQIETTLRLRHNLTAASDNDFSIFNQQSLLETAASISQTMTIFLGAVGAISLLVGGIGIMNIMLVSVTERTREIGVRMAVGARARDVLAQFLAEALVLAVAGGVIGVAAGVGIAWRLAVAFGWPVLFRADVVLLAVGFSGHGFMIAPAVGEAIAALIAGGTADLPIDEFSVTRFSSAASREGMQI